MNEWFSKSLLIKACTSKVGQSSSDTPANSDDFNETKSDGHHVYSSNRVYLQECFLVLFSIWICWESLHNVKMFSNLHVLAKNACHSMAK